LWSHEVFENMIDGKQLWQMWDDLALTKLFQSFRMAIGPTKVAIAFLAVLVICFVGWIMDVCTRTVVVNPNQVSVRKQVSSDVLKFSDATELEVYIAEPHKTKSFIEKYKGKAPMAGVFSTLWNFGSARFNHATVLLLKLDTSNIVANIFNVIANIWLCVEALVWALRYHPFYSIVYFSIVVCVICLSGGAICRCAALEFARGESPGLLEAIGFSYGKFRSLLAGPLLPVVLMLICAFFVFLLGLIGAVPRVGELIMGVGLCLAMVFGLFTVMLLVGTLAGLSMMFPVIGYEGSNGRDAVSRSFMYVLSQPWWMIFYTFVAVIWGTISYLFVRFGVYLVLIATYVLLNLGICNSTEGADKLARIWPRPDFFDLSGLEAVPANWTETVAAFVVHLTVLVFVGFVVAFVISFYFCASTVVYSLMRKKVDNVPTENVYLRLDEIRGDEP
jgi:hypothetical protein